MYIKGTKIYTALLLTVILILPSMSYVFSQADKPLREEFSSLGRKGDYSVLLAENKGLMIIRNDGKTKNDEIIWRFWGYSTDMVRKWKSTFSMEKHYEFSRKFYRAGFGNILYADVSNNESRLKHIQINMETGEVKSRDFKVDFKFQIRDFKVVNSAAYVLGLNAKGLNSFFKNIFKSDDEKGHRIRFFKYDWEQNKLTNFSELIDEGMRPKRLNIHKAGKEIDIFMARAITEQQDEIWMYSFGFNGKLNQKHKFSSVSGKNVVDLVVTSAGSKRYIGATMSSLRNRYNNYEDYTDGLYFSIFKKGKEINSRFHKLSNLRAFYNKAEPEMFQFFPGKDKVDGSVGYQLKLHPELKATNNKMILLAEAYYPEYHKEWYYDAYGVSHTRKVFDGYRYTHALAVAFNAKAKVTWNVSMEINGIKSYSRDRRVDIIAEEGNAGIVYNLDNELHYQTLKGGKNKQNPATVTLPMLYDNDQLKESEDGRIRYWYGSYMLATGYQHIDHENKGNREVFYLFKIGFQ